MKTIQCTHPPHNHNSFVTTCRLWTASGGVHALLVLEPTLEPCIVHALLVLECLTNTRVLNKHKARSIIHT